MEVISNILYFLQIIVWALCRLWTCFVIWQFLLMQDCSGAPVSYWCPFLFFYNRRWSAVVVMCACSCLTFGIVGQTVGLQFYQTPNLAATLAGCLFAGLSAQPEHRLRVTSRIFSFHLLSVTSRVLSCIFVVLVVGTDVLSWWHHPCHQQWLSPSQISSPEDVLFLIHTTALVIKVWLLSVCRCVTLCFYLRQASVMNSEVGTENIFFCFISDTCKKT